RFWIALGAELLLFGSLNFFDDWTLEWMPVRFVSCAILCGLAYLIAGTEFEAIKQNPGWIFWGATVALRLLALPLTPANEVWRFQLALGSALALGAAIAFRPVCGVLLVPTFFSLRRYSIALTAAIAVPVSFAFAFRFSFRPDLFGDFGHVSRLNDLFWWLIEDTILPNWHQQHYRYDVIILIVSVAIALAFARNWRRGLVWSLCAALILAPVLHAWYLVWILPIATWRRAFAWH